MIIQDTSDKNNRSAGLSRTDYSLATSTHPNGGAQKMPVEDWDRRFTAAYPPAEGAQNAVIGGPPEDMNMMPATGFIDTDTPIYDGSHKVKDKPKE